MVAQRFATPARQVSSAFFVTMMVLLPPQAMSETEGRVSQTPIDETPRIAEDLTVSEFVPPERKVSKQGPDVATVADTSGVMRNGKRLRVVRAEPSALPDLDTLTRERVVKQATANAISEEDETEPDPWEAYRVLSFGATVVDRRVSFINWMDAGGKRHQAVCGFDIGLLAGIGEFVKARTHYSLLLLHGNHNTRRDGEVARLGFPDIEVNEWEIVLLEEGKEWHGDANGMEDLKAVRDLIRSEKERLVEYQRNRKERNRQAREWHEKNPVPPKDETVWLRPHEGSRYFRKNDGPVKPTADMEGGGE